MRRLLALALAFMGVTAQAGQPFSVRSCRSCVQQQVVHSAQVVHAAPIVNTVVGVPVPVLYNAPIAQQGNTVYGYVQNSAIIAPNTVDLAVLYNQANRLAEQAQQLAAQANSDFQTLVKLEAANQSARLQAQSGVNITLKIENGQVTVQEPYKLISPQSATQSTTQSYCPDASCPQPAQQLQSMKAVEAPSALTLDSIVGSKCYNCHNAKNSKGGLSFDVPVSTDMQQSILERITTDDPSLSMPRKADGSAAAKLDKAELDIFYQAMGVKR